MSSSLPGARRPHPAPAAVAAAPLRILFVEDDPRDVELEVRALRAGGIACEWERVDTEDALLARLADGAAYDLIIADYRLPAFDGLAALRLARERRPELPFVIVSGTLGDEAAIETVRLGATDYVLKDRLERLPPVVHRVLRDAEQSRRRARVETHTRALIEIGRELSGARDLLATLCEVCTRVAAVTPCATVVIAGDATGGDGGHVLAQHGLDTGGAPRGPRLLEPQGALDAALRRRTTVSFRDRAEIAGLPTLAQAGVTDLVAAPVHWHGRHFGALILANGDGQHLDADQIAFAEALAPQIAAALDAADLRRAEREEGEIATALARIGQELISSVDLPVLLDRLCRVTTEMLRCEVAYTLLYREEEEVYVPVASFGYAPERWEAVRALRVPRALVPALADPIHRDGMLHATEQLYGRAVPPELLAAYDVRELLAIALRRGPQLVGVHVAAQRTPGRTFGAREYGIANGLAQLASLALENARLVDKLEAANQLKAVFLATMSHELRTPLNVIIGYAELLLDEVFGRLSPEQTASLDRIGTSARELLELISATLDISRLETGRSALALEDIVPSALLNEIEVETAAVRDKPGVESIWDIPAELPPLHSDAVKVKVLLKNLISNAFKFTDRGSVTIAARATDSWLELRVTDTGIGMTPEVQAVIFEPFRQGDSSTTRRHGGVGLGLYIVSRLLDLLGGRVEVESAPGQGSSFRVWIPLDALRTLRLPAPSAPVTPRSGA